jgi:hypothetical protein
MIIRAVHQSDVRIGQSQFFAERESGKARAQHHDLSFWVFLVPHTLIVLQWAKNAKSILRKFKRAVRGEADSEHWRALGMLSAKAISRYTRCGNLTKLGQLHLDI